MKIDFSYIPQAFYSFKEKAYDSLTPQQKLICAVAIAALAGLAVCAKVFYSRYKENINRLRLETEERERAQELLRAQERERAQNHARELERQVRLSLENDYKRELLTTEAKEVLDPLLAEAKFQEAFSYGKDASLLSAYAFFLMGQKKWADLELQLVELMQLGEEFFKNYSVKEKYVRALSKQNKTSQALSFLEKELLFNTQAFYSNAVLSRYYARLLSDQGEDREVELFMENGFKNNFNAFCSNSFLIDEYTNLLLWNQEDETEAFLVLENSLQANPEVFYSISNLAEKYALNLLYCQNKPQEAERSLSKAMQKHPKEPAFIMARTEALIRLNRPYEETIAALLSILPELMEGNLACYEYEDIALLAKYIEVQRQFGFPANEQLIKLRALIREKSTFPEEPYEKTWFAIGLRVLGHMNDSLEFLRDALKEAPTDKITQREFEITVRDAEVEHKAHFEMNKDSAKDYFSFLNEYKEEKEAVDFFLQIANTDYKKAQECLGELFDSEKYELALLLLENQLNNNRDEFFKADLYGPFAALSIYEFKKNQEKVIEFLLNPQCLAWRYMDKYKFFIEASLQINRPPEEILQNLGKEMVDWANSPDNKNDVALLAKYIDLHLKCRKSIDAPLNTLQELLKEIPVNSHEKCAHSVAFRVIGDTEKAQELLQEAYEESPKDYLIKYEYLKYFFSL
jgi:predicted Zn-dependent protease